MVGAMLRMIKIPCISTPSHNGHNLTTDYTLYSENNARKGPGSLQCLLSGVSRCDMFIISHFCKLQNKECILSPTSNKLKINLAILSLFISSQHYIRALINFVLVSIKEDTT